MTNNRKIFQSRSLLGILAGLMAILLGSTSSSQCLAETLVEGVPLVIGHRTIHVFRAPLGAFSATERAEGARRRIDRAFEEPGDGWTSVKTTDQGMQVELDGKPLFLVVPGDATGLTGETADDLANKASRVLQKAWSEVRESRDSRANLYALLKVLAASALLAIVLTLLVKLSGLARRFLAKRLMASIKTLSAVTKGSRLIHLIPATISRLVILAAWLLGLLATLGFLTYSLGQFVLTRPVSEDLAHSIGNMATQSLFSVAQSVPGMFIAVIIFLIAWVFVKISTEMFTAVLSSPSELFFLNAHTAPATRRIVNASIWLFAIAMAYPYLPGSHTDAFKGLSVILGLAVSVGASGVVGQIASGLILVYTYALRVGEYVRIQEFEGTVTGLGVFVTRIRTGLGEELAIPNALVLSNVTRNFSRGGTGDSFMLDVPVTIGYDTPWRQVHTLLLEAAASVPEISGTPKPYVVQTALSDFYVAYKLVVHIDTERPAVRAQVVSALHAAIQDAFNRNGVQIMSPHYVLDPKKPKLVIDSE